MPFTTADRTKLEQKLSSMIDDFPIDFDAFIDCCDMMIDMATVAADARREDEETKEPPPAAE